MTGHHMGDLHPLRVSQGASGAAAKFEIRNSKSETMNPTEKSKCPNQRTGFAQAFGTLGDLDLSVCFGFRISDFGFLSGDPRSRDDAGSPRSQSGVSAAALHTGRSCE
jgi:hypothetical protein